MEELMGFNPTLVRLRLPCFSFGEAIFGGFNPTLVRLRHG